MTIEADYNPDFETMFGESPSTGPEMGAEDKYGAASDAIRFLKAFHEGGRHNIVAIHPNGGGSVGRTFGPNSWDGMAGYINRLHANGYNIYFTVNEPKAGAPDSKLDKTEIGSIRAVYADPDIRDGRDHEERRDAAHPRSHRRARLYSSPHHRLGQRLPPAMVAGGAHGRRRRDKGTGRRHRTHDCDPARRGSCPEY